MKKVLSLVLVLALVLGSFSFAFAFDDVADLDCEDAVETLVALGVIDGFSDGTFRPTEVVTRAQMAKMLIVVSGYGDLVTGSTSSFSDCQGHWADEYIAFAAGQGIVKGYPDGTFGPDEDVTYNQAITMVVRALGYNDDCLTGTWPANYKIKAVDLDITEDVKVTSGGADRGGVAQLIFNALECVLVYVDDESEVHKVTDVDGNKVLLDRLGDKDKITQVTPDMIDEDSDLYVDSEVDLEPYMYESLKIYVNNDDDVIYVSGTDTTKNIEGKLDADAGANLVVKKTSDDKKVTIAGAKMDELAKMYYNGAEALFTAKDWSTLTKGAVVKVVFPKDAKGNADTDLTPAGIVVEELTDIIQVTDVYDSDVLDDISGITLPTTEDDDDETVLDVANIAIEGDATTLEDIEEDDIINYYQSDDQKVIKLVVTRNTVEGKVTKVTKSSGNVTKAVIDGVTYDVNYSEWTKASKLGSEGTFFLDKDGEIVAFEGESTTLSDYAIVKGVDDGTYDDFGSDNDVTESPRIMLLTDEGESVVYDLYVEFDETTLKTFDVDNKYSATNGFAVTFAAVTDGAPAKTLVADTNLEDTIIKYELNSDGAVDGIEIVALKPLVGKQVKSNMIDETYDFTSNTVIFNKDNTGATPKYTQEEYDDLEEKVAHDYYVTTVEDSLGELELVFAVNAVSAGDAGNYAVVVEVNDVLNSDDDEVKEVKVLLKGEEQTYLTKTSTVVVDDTTGQVLNLKINSDDLITDAPVIAPETAGFKTVKAVDAKLNKVQLSDNTLISLEEEVSVYLYDESEEEYSIVSLGNIKKNYLIKEYKSDADNKVDTLLVVRD